MHNWKTSIVSVDPEMAQAILNQNYEGQRKVKPNVVQRYATAMTQGDWTLSPEPIVISNKNELIDGQHRLQAIIESGTMQAMFVVEGVPDKAYKVLNRGVTRTAADALGINAKLAQTARLFCTTHVSSRQVTDAMIERAAEIFDGPHSLLATSNRTRLASAPVRLGAVLNILKYPTYANEIAENYRKFIASSFFDLPPVFSSLSRRLDAQTVNRTSVYKLHPAYVAFNPKNHDKKNIRSTSSLVEEMRSETSDLFNKVLGGNK